MTLLLLLLLRLASPQVSQTSYKLKYEMSSITPLDKLNIDGITAKPPRQMGKAKLVFLEPKMLVNTPALEQAWPIRPMGDDGADKFQLECRLGDSVEAFKSALTSFDMRVRRLAFENKKSWFGKSADEIETENDLKQMHTLSVRKGNEKADGSRYDDTVKFKITGWADYIDEVLYKGEGDKRFAVDVKWKSRLVDPQRNGGPDDSQTQFYICEGINMSTGKQKMAPWTPCVDPAGHEIKDALGNTLWEFVGPKHCQPGCKITVVYQPTMVWLASKFGVTLGAKQVFITPAPPKPKSAIEGIEIVETVDPILASKAARAALASDDIRDLDDVPDNASADDVAADVTALANGVAPAGSGPSGPSAPSAPSALDEEKPKKRKADKVDDPSKSPKKKVSKTVTVDESF